jgi:hypothetical protein
MGELSNPRSSESWVEAIAQCLRDERGLRRVRTGTHGGVGGAEPRGSHYPIIGPSRRFQRLTISVAIGALRTWLDLQLAPPSRS